MSRKNHNIKEFFYSSSQHQHQFFCIFYMPKKTGRWFKSLTTSSVRSNFGYVAPLDDCWKIWPKPVGDSGFGFFAASIFLAFRQKSRDSPRQLPREKGRKTWWRRKGNSKKLLVTVDSMKRGGKSVVWFYIFLSKPHFFNEEILWSFFDPII